MFQADVELTFSEDGLPVTDDQYRYSKKPEIKVGHSVCYIVVSVVLCAVSGKAKSTVK